jgi:hypothetical protein
MNRMLARCSALAVAVAALAPMPAHAFCGFFVGKAGAELYNHGSKVVIARDGNRTVLTMSADFKGELKDFALVVPVPTVLQKEQIHIGDQKLVDRIDNYSAPRLVKYVDPDPCEMRRYRAMESAGAPAAKAAPAPHMNQARADALGVKVEAEYTVGEYDIVILSAKQSDGLETYLHESGYQIPAKAAAALAPYIKQNMKFFVAKVNLKEQAASGFNYLRPIQMAYESEKFMLPIRLGMANADGPQDMLVFTITPRGRVESVNYKTVKMTTDSEVPLFVKEEFGKFYKAVFERAYEHQEKRAVFTEYAWNASWCDPCADTPLAQDELRQLGVFWLGETANPGYGYRRGMSGGQPMITRLHVRYDAAHFPEDLVFQETGDQTNFQARYIMHEPFRGNLECEAGQQYKKQLAQRHEKEAVTLAEITGWPREEIVQKMGPDAPGATSGSDDGWYKNLWK